MTIMQTLISFWTIQTIKKKTIRYVWYVFWLYIICTRCWLQLFVSCRVSRANISLPFPHISLCHVDFHRNIMWFVFTRSDPVEFLFGRQTTDVSDIENLGRYSSLAELWSDLWSSPKLSNLVLWPWNFRA